MKFALVVGFTVLTADTLFAQSAAQGDLDALKARMDQMQKQYEQRIEKMDQERKQDKEQISKMEAEIKELASKAASGNSILNTRVLTDAEGKGMEARGPLLDESFLKSLTRNFSFQIYMRAGVAFNGSGGGGNFNFEIPDGNGGRFRLGNENDFYMEVTFNQFHILGESPDMMDVSLRITPVFFNDITKISFDTTTNEGRDFNVGMREAFVEVKNVFKTAPEITFWGGQRFYDRQNIDPNDWYWLDSSGWGTGVKNISAGPGTLAIAWLGGIQDNLHLNSASTNVLNNVGNLFKHTLDIRYSDVDIGFGKLTFYAIGNYMKGGSYGVTGIDLAGNPVAGTVKTSDAYGIGGGMKWLYEFGNKSYLELAALFGYGATNFGSVTDPGTQEGLINNDWLNAVDRFEFRGQKRAPSLFSVANFGVS